MQVIKASGSELVGQSGEWVEIVRKAVDGLNFGFVQILVHNGQVVQIEKTEKVRLEQSR
jgi:hypothetical protein